MLGGSGVCWVEVGCVGWKWGVLGGSGACWVEVGRVGWKWGVLGGSGACWVEVGCAGWYVSSTQGSDHWYSNTAMCGDVTLSGSLAEGMCVCAGM